MSNELQNTNGNLPTDYANDASNPFIAYGDAVGMTRIVGTLLKFDKFGEWISGEEGEVIPHGTRLVANIDELLVGWVKWQNNKPVEQLMSRVIDGKKPQLRSELGDNDESLWEVDDNGRSRDPWQLSNYLIFKEHDSNELYTYATASRGGIQAIGGLAKEYGQKMRHRPNDFPIVEIGESFYMHSKKEYGKIKIPTFKIVGWAPKADMLNALDGGQGALDLDEGKPATAKIPGPNASTRF